MARLAARAARIPLALLALAALGCRETPAPAPPPLDPAALAAEVKAEFLHAWRGYERYAVRSRRAQAGEPHARTTGASTRCW